MKLHSNKVGLTISHLTFGLREIITRGLFKRYGTVRPYRVSEADVANLKFAPRD